MKTLLTLFTVLLLSSTSFAQDVLPFGVKIGDHNAAMTEDTSLFAKLAGPVSNNAAMSVKDVEGQIIVNIFPSDENGEVQNGVQPMILLFQASESKAINTNMQGTTPKSGWYAANVVGGGKTARILFQVK